MKNIARLQHFLARNNIARLQHFLEALGIESPGLETGRAEHWRYLVRLCLLAGASGGIFHATSMAVKKKWGDGVERYWLEKMWWSGVFVDLVGGLLIEPAMPFVSVQILMPVVIVSQALSSYAFGMLLFNEPVTLRSGAGVVFGMAGVSGLCLIHTNAPSRFMLDSYWWQWLQRDSLCSLAASAVIMVICVFSRSQSTLWATVAGFIEGVHFTTSRALADGIFLGDGLGSCLKSTTWWDIVILKIVCIVAITHACQLGLATDLSRFAAKYLVASSAFTVWFGAAFFGDRLDLTLAFFSSVSSTLVGVWLLSEKPSTESPCA